MHGDDLGDDGLIDPERIASVRRWLSAHPFNLWMGLEFQDLGPRRTTLTFRVREHHRYISGLLHGGIHATLLDTVMGVAARLATPENEAVRTRRLEIEYLAPSRAEFLQATAHVERLESQNLSVRGEVGEGTDSQVVSTGVAQFTRVPRRRGTQPQADS